MKLILIGLPGAGKGTVGAALAPLLSIPHLSMGDYVRELVASASDPLGEKIRKEFQGSDWKPFG